MNTRFFKILAFFILFNFAEVSFGDIASQLSQLENRGVSERGHFDQGVQYINSREWDKAILEMNEVLRVEPNNTMALEYRAGAYFANHDFEQVISDYSRVIDAEPKNARALYNRGAAYSAMEEFDEALHDFERCATLNPTNGLAYKARADIFNWKRGNFREAVKDYRKALVLIPNDVQIMNDLAWLYGTSSTKTVRNGKQAVRLSEKACVLTGWKNPDYIDTLAAAYAENGEFEKAAKYEQQALGLVGDKDVVQKKVMENRLQLFRDRNPYREGKHYEGTSPLPLQKRQGEQPRPSLDGGRSLGE